MNFTDLLIKAKEVVSENPLWKKWIDGTPLANDIPVWMAEFALENARTPISNDATVDAIEVAARAIAGMAEHNMALDAYGKPVLYNEEGIAQAALSAAYPALVKERDALREMLEKLVRLHMSEQEGMECGMPTAQQWRDTVDEAVEVLKTTKGGA